MSGRCARPPRRTGTLLGLVIALTATASAGAQEITLQAHRLEGLRADLATLLLSGVEGGSIPIVGLAVPLPAEPGADPATARSVVPFLVEIEGSGLLQAGTGPVREVEVYAYAVAPDNKVPAFSTQRFRLPLESLGEAVSESGLKFAGLLELPPGRYSLRLLVVNRGTQQYGLRALDVSVPGPGETAPALLTPLLAEPPGSWILVLQGAKPEDQGKLQRALSSLRVGGGLPAVYPVIEAGNTLALALLGRALPRSPRLALSAVDESGKPVAQAEVGILSRGAVGPDGLERIEARVEAPGLKSGRYRLNVTALGSHHESLSSPALGVALLRDAAVGGPIVWSQLRTAQAAEDEAAAQDLRIDLPKSRKRRDAAVVRVAREGYEEALRILSSGAPLERAVEHTARFESALVAETSVEGLDLVRDVEIATAQGLSRLDNESLMPVLMLHMELYRHYREQQRFLLATHARRLTATLAEMYAAGDSRSEVQTVAADALASLAVYLLEGKLRRSSQALLQRSLELDSNNEPALLHLATAFERYGQYEEAATTLRHLVRLNPKSPEARLRLAVNLLRSGRAQQGLSILERLVSENNPDWILALAYQELARELMAQDRLAPATRLLRQAVDRLPGEERLSIQLAFLLDRQRRSQDARQALSRLRPGGRSYRESPRHRYNRWPYEALEGTRRALARGSTVRQPVLASALRRLVGEEAG